MRTSWAAGAALALLASPALADQHLAARWDGFYVGVNAGFVAGDLDPDYKIPAASNIGASARATADAALGLLDGFTDGGFIGGAQFGYDRQYGQYVFGLAADAQALNFGEESATSYNPLTATQFFEHDFDLQMRIARVKLDYRF